MITSNASQQIYNYRQESNFDNDENSNDRNTPNSSDGIGSSIASSPSHSDSSHSSPVNNKFTYSTPYHSVNPNRQHLAVNPGFYNSPSNYQQNPNNYYNNQYFQTAQQYSYNYQNNYSSYNQYVNTNNSVNHDDSNYYSRNNSCNESKIVNKPIEPKKPLSFSIEVILGLNNQKEKVSQENSCPQLDQSNQVEDEEEFKDKSRKKRSRKSSDSASSNKRIRTIFTQEQLDKLEVEFLRQQYMVGSERSYLASTLNLTESQVKIWFQNRRIKWRKSQCDSKANNGDFLNQTCSNDSNCGDD